MKRLFIFILCSIFGFNLMAQTIDYKAVPQSHQRQLFQRVSRATQSLQCQFVQSKSSTMLADAAVSKGQLSFIAPDRLRWEYSEPVAFAFVYNQGKVSATNSLGESISQNTRMIQELSRVVLNLLSGNVEQFSVHSFYCPDHYKVILKPNNARLKSLFQSIELRIDSKNFVAQSVTLFESNGDATAIQFLNPNLNPNLSETLFKIK